MHLVLDRAETHNALRLSDVESLHRDVAATTERVVVLSSSTPGAFCSGADRRVSDAERRQLSDALYALYEGMRASDAIFIAAVDGPAVGGGAQLAVAADLCFVGSRGWFRFVGVGHGLAVGAWGLPALVGRGRALDLCLSMRRLEAAEAVAIGIAQRLVDDPVGAATAYGMTLRQADGEAVTRVKRVVELGARTGESLAEERQRNMAWNGSLSLSKRCTSPDYTEV